MEAALVKYPEARFLQLQRELETERQERREAWHEYEKLKESYDRKNAAGRQIESIHQEVQSMSTKISEQLAPATLKTM